MIADVIKPPSAIEWRVDNYPTRDFYPVSGEEIPPSGEITLPHGDYQTISFLSDGRIVIGSMNGKAYSFDPGDPTLISRIDVGNMNEYIAHYPWMLATRDFSFDQGEFPYALQMCPTCSPPRIYWNSLFSDFRYITYPGRDPSITNGRMDSMKTDLLYRLGGFYRHTVATIQVLYNGSSFLQFSVSFADPAHPGFTFLKSPCRNFGDPTHQVNACPLPRNGDVVVNGHSFYEDSRSGSTVGSTLVGVPDGGYSRRLLAQFGISGRSGYEPVYNWYSIFLSNEEEHDALNPNTAGQLLNSSGSIIYRKTATGGIERIVIPSEYSQILSVLTDGNASESMFQLGDILEVYVDQDNAIFIRGNNSSDFFRFDLSSKKPFVLVDQSQSIGFTRLFTLSKQVVAGGTIVSGHVDDLTGERELVSEEVDDSSILSLDLTSDLNQDVRDRLTTNYDIGDGTVKSIKCFGNEVCAVEIEHPDHKSIMIIDSNGVVIRHIEGLPLTMTNYALGAYETVDQNGRFRSVVRLAYLYIGEDNRTILGFDDAYRPVPKIFLPLVQRNESFRGASQQQLNDRLQVRSRSTWNYIPKIPDGISD